MTEEEHYEAFCKARNEYAFVLRTEFGRTYREIGERLGVVEGRARYIVLREMHRREILPIEEKAL